MTKFSSGNIIPDKISEPQERLCCLHKNLVPLEFGIATKSYPQGFKNDPYYNFAVSLVSANVIRVKTYLCLDCKREIKAPNPGEIKKDIL